MKRIGNGKTLENTPEKGRKSVILVKRFFNFLSRKLPQFPLCSGKPPRYLSIGCPVNGKPEALRRAAGAITSRTSIIVCFLSRYFVSVCPEGLLESLGLSGERLTSGEAL